MMTLSCYYSPHDDSEGAPQHDNETPRPREQESKSNDEPFQEDHPPAATSTSPEANNALTMVSHRAAKKRRTSDNCSLSPSTQSHQYQYQQKSSSVRAGGLNENCSSTFATTVTRMPNTNTYNGDKEEASSANKEIGKKPSQVHPQEQEGGDPNPINDTTMWNPYLPHRFQVFSPSHAQLHLSPSSHFHPPHEQHDEHENPDDNPLPLPLAVPYSPVRRQFGDEYYISPRQERPAPAAHLKKDPPPSAAAVATEEMKANSDGGGGDSVDLLPTLPSLPVKGVRTSTSSQRNAWDRKFHDLLEFKQQHGHCDVPQTYAPNPKLGVWVNKQRMEQKNREDGNISTLTDERLERLQSIGFRWAKRRGQVRWDEKYGELIQYAAKFGNCHVPTKYKENTALGRWVSTQRAEYKTFCKGEKSSLTAEKIRRLDSIGFAWFMAL
eukprot:scaffold9241_cov135-Skeletonema_marinoi.AAC.2